MENYLLNLWYSEWLKTHDYYTDDFLGEFHKHFPFISITLTPNNVWIIL